MLDWVADWVKRGRRELRQADQVRGPRWQFLTALGDRPPRLRRHRGRPGALRRSRLEPDRRRLGVLHRRGRACSASATSTAGCVAERCGAAVRRRRRLDLDGAGRRRASPSRLGLAAGRDVRRDAAPGRVACRCSTRRRPAPRSIAAAASSSASPSSAGKPTSPRWPIVRSRDPGVDLGDRGDGRGADRARPTRSAASVARPCWRSFAGRATTRAWLADDGERLRHDAAPVGARRRSVRSSRATRRLRWPSSSARSMRRGPRLHRRADAPACAAASARARGFTRQRPFVRMALGATPAPRRRARACSPSPAPSSADDEAMTMATRSSPLSTDALRARLFDGLAIPAHPLALDAERRLDRRRQRALARYYLDAGAGGLAVGVHTTQFAIREAGLFEEVLADRRRDRARLAAARPGRPRRRCSSPAPAGTTPQAIAEARLARGLGYDAVLLSLAALQGASDDALIAHCAGGRRRDAADRLLSAAGGRRARARRARSGRASRRSPTWSRSRSRRSTATARSTSCAAWSRHAPRSESRSIPATTTTSSSTSSRRSRRCATAPR